MSLNKTLWACRIIVVLGYPLAAILCPIAIAFLLLSFVFGLLSKACDEASEAYVRLSETLDEAYKAWPNLKRWKSEEKKQ